MGNYWGKVCIDRKGRARAFKLNGVTRRVFEEYNIPKFVKTKMAMLDMIDHHPALSCGSYKTTFTGLVISTATYHIYKDVSSTREESEARERSVNEEEK